MQNNKHIVEWDIPTIQVSKIKTTRCPRLRTRILWKLFPNFRRFGWRWYHTLIPEKLLKIFNKHYVPWTYSTGYEVIIL